MKKLFSLVVLVVTSIFGLSTPSAKAQAPVINALGVSPNQIHPNDPFQVFWNVNNADTILLFGLPGGNPDGDLLTDSSGILSVLGGVTQTSTFMLGATKNGQSAVQQITIDVIGSTSIESLAQTTANEPVMVSIYDQIGRYITNYRVNKNGPLLNSSELDLNTFYVVRIQNALGQVESRIMCMIR